MYDSDKTVKAAGYAMFPIKGYEFYEFSDSDRIILKNDWRIVRDFIAKLQSSFEDYESQYPRISSELRSKLLFIDTAPKWPKKSTRLWRQFMNWTIKFIKEAEPRLHVAETIAAYGDKLHKPEREVLAMGIPGNFWRDGLFACMAICMCLLLEWDKNAIKCFISGGVIASWLTLRVIRSRRHESKQG